MEKVSKSHNFHKKAAILGVILFGILVFIGFYLLSASQTGLNLQTPWQTISPYYIYVFFGATLTLGFLISSHLQARYILGLIVVYSFLIHSYLPLTHELFYGADGWRHIANEAQILEGHWPSSPILRDGSQAGFGVGDLAYSGFWVLSAGASYLSGLDLVTITKWLVPVLWSLFFPLLAFLIFKQFGWSDKKSLFGVWLSSLPFALQAAGSFSLPVNLGFLVWLIGLYLIFKRLASIEPGPTRWLLIFGLLSIFNYTLYFVLFWLVWGMGELVREWIKRHGKISFKFAAIIGALAGISLVVLQLAARYSEFEKVNFLAALKQLVGNFTGWYLVFGPRPHIIDAGNFIFNQVPSYAFVPNLFTAGRLWIVPFAILFFVGVFWGARMFVRRHHALSLTVVLFSAGLFGSYIISRYFMGGENVLSRRFDVVLAFLLLIFAVESVGWLMEHSRHRLSVALIFVFSFAIAASYSLGPNTQTVSADEFKAMQYVWSQEKNEAKHCVIADTYPLLALEAISSKQIVGGGFPIDSNFAQPERELTYNNIKFPVDWVDNGYKDYKKALEITGAPHCWFVGWGDPLEPIKLDPADNHTDLYFERY